MKKIKQKEKIDVNKPLGNPLGYEKISKLLRQFAIPSIVAMVVSSLYNIVDQVFIGQGVGKLGNAATNVAFPITTICLAICLLIGIGGAAKFSLELGAGHKDKAAECIGNAVWLASIIGIIYAILVEIFLEKLMLCFGATSNVLPYAMDYVRITAIGMPLLIMTNVVSALARADGSPRYSMTCMIVGAVINTILDPVFIFGFDMGVKGAALATVISQVVSFVVAIAYLFRFKTVKITKNTWDLRPAQSLKMASLGLSNSFTQLAITVLQIVMNNSLTHYGALTKYGADTPLAAFGIIMKVNGLIVSVFVGLSQGCQPLIGYNYGAGQYDRVKKIYLTAIKCSFVISLIGFIAFEVFPKYIISLFGAGDALYMEFAVRFMRIFLFCILINGVQLISSNFFAAIGKPMKGVILALSRQTFFVLPLVIILPLFMGLDGIPFAGPIADFIAFIIVVYFVKKEFKYMGEINKENK